uniref:Ig-like domain-containing protein n=1 Tax=Hucho hucho TaxID=62062 RepID=A0A4W5LBY3_9TELE
MMRVLYLLLLCDTSVQLQCDKTVIQANVGSGFNLVCQYQTNKYLFSKKYWCRGESRSTCVILMDSDHLTNGELRHRSQIIDAQRRGLVIIMTELKLDDTGVYWVGIDKIYADIMTSINLIVTFVAVSKPMVWPPSSMGDTCWGQPVTVHCASAQGTSVQYTWYQSTQPQDIQFQSSADLHLHCGIVEEDSQYYCSASNDVSSQQSGMVSLQVLKPSEEDCIYSFAMEGQRSYDCSDRLKTSTATPLRSNGHLTEEPYQPGTNSNLSSTINQTHQDWRYNRAWALLPVWYEILRWLFLATLIAAVCLVHKFRPTQV